MTMADRSVVMSNGNVEQMGAPLDIYDNPANTFVAKFIGSPGINLIEGTVRRRKERASVEASDGTQLPLNPNANVEDGQKITYGIRPEHISLREGGFSGAIELIEPTGAETLVFSKIGKVEICARTMERSNVKRGDSVGFMPDINKVLLFNVETGARH